MTVTESTPITGDAMTFEQLAQLLQVSPRQLYRWRKDGKFKTVEGLVEAVTRQPATLIPKAEADRLYQERFGQPPSGNESVA